MPDPNLRAMRPRHAEKRQRQTQISARTTAGSSPASTDTRHNTKRRPRRRQPANRRHGGQPTAPATYRDLLEVSREHPRRHIATTGFGRVRRVADRLSASGSTGWQEGIGTLMLAETRRRHLRQLGRRHRHEHLPTDRQDLHRRHHHRHPVPDHTKPQGHLDRAPHANLGRDLQIDAGARQTPRPITTLQSHPPDQRTGGDRLRQRQPHPLRRPRTRLRPRLRRGRRHHLRRSADPHRKSPRGHDPDRQRREKPAHHPHGHATQTVSTPAKCSPTTAPPASHTTRTAHRTSSTTATATPPTPTHGPRPTRATRTARPPTPCSACRNLGEDSFRREALGIWDQDTEHAAIDPELWAQAATPERASGGWTAMAIDMPPHRGWITIGRMPGLRGRHRIHRHRCPQRRQETRHQMARRFPRPPLAAPSPPSSSTPNRRPQCSSRHSRPPAST